MADTDYPLRIGVTFCDDVRQEVSNKYTIVGIYQNIIAIDAPYAVMPKLVVMVSLDGALGRIGTEIRIVLWERETEIFRQSFAWPQPEARFAIDPRLNPRANLLVPIELVAHQIRDGMVYRVEVDCGEVHFESDPVRVIARNRPETESSAA